MRTIALFITFLLLAPAANSQSRGVERAGGQNPPDEGTLRAVVIGISQYRDSLITDLQFAHRDAEAFARYCLEHEGLQEENLKLLTEEKATSGNIMAALFWLQGNSKPGDKAYIFFAGHGDVETQSEQQFGFLLPQDIGFNNYFNGGISLAHLNVDVSMLAARGVKVVVITDACHSGKLAGNNIGGAGQTAQAWQNMRNNAIKLMSCLPDQKSEEGLQWGDGRGAFSWYLINGLVGLADRDEDLLVKLSELGSYLQTKVPEEANEQYPWYDGDPRVRMAIVREDALARLREGTTGSGETMAMAATTERSITDRASSARVKELATNFQAALTEGDLIDGENSAEGLLEKLEKAGADESLLNSCRFALLSELLEKGRSGIGAYLRADSTELMRRYRTQAFSGHELTVTAYDEEYFKVPDYLDRAAEMLGEEHPAYNNTRARSLYLEGVLQRLARRNHRNQKRLLSELIELQETALDLEPQAAFIHNELGILHRLQGKTEKAREFYLQAEALSPTWALPPANLMSLDLEDGRVAEVISRGLELEEAGQAYFGTYYTLGRAFELNRQLISAEEYYHKAIELENLNYRPFMRLGFVYMDMLHYREADSMFLEAEKRMGYLDSIYLLSHTDGDGVPDFYDNMSENLILSLPPEPDLFELAVRLNPSDADAYFELGLIYLQEGRTAKAEKQFRRVMELEPGGLRAYRELLDIFRAQDRQAETALMYRRISELQPSPENLLAEADFYASVWQRPFRKEELFHREMAKQAIGSPDWLFWFAPLDSLLGDQGRRREQEFWYAQYLPFDDEKLKGFYENMTDHAPAEYHHKLAIQAMQQEAWGMAAYHYREALSASAAFRQDAQIHLQLARCYLQQGHLSGARHSLQRVLELSPQHTYAIEKLAWLEDHFRRRRLALDRLEQLRELDKAGFPEQVLWTEYQLYENREEQAASELQSLQDIALPGDSLLADLTFRFTARQDDPAQILAQASSFIAEFPTQRDRIYDLAVAHQQTGNAEQALRYLHLCAERGFRYPKLLKYDPRLEDLRETEGFQEYLSRYDISLEREAPESLIEEYFPWLKR